MQSVTGTSLTALHSSKSQLELRPVQHGPKNLRHEHHHDHRERTHRHGRRAAQVFRHLLHQRVAFRVYGRVVERMFGVVDAQKAGALLKGPCPET